MLVSAYDDFVIITNKIEIWEEAVVVDALNVFNGNIVYVLTRGEDVTEDDYDKMDYAELDGLCPAEIAYEYSGEFVTDDQISYVWIKVV